jgi:hypothetical protein
MTRTYCAETSNLKCEGSTAPSPIPIIRRDPEAILPATDSETSSGSAYHLLSRRLLAWLILRP